MVNKLVYLANETRPDYTLRRADYGVRASPIFGYYQQLNVTVLNNWFLKKNGGFGGKVYNHPDSSIPDGKSIGIHSSDALHVEQILQPGFELIFKGIQYQFGKPFEGKWNIFQAEWEEVMEKRREFLDRCARNNAVRTNVSRQSVSTPTGIESVPSAAAQSSPQQSPFNFEYDERSYATVKTAQPGSVKLRPSSVTRNRKATHAHMN